MMSRVNLRVTTKQQTHSRYTQDKEKGIKVYHHKKSSIHKGIQKERNKGTKEVLNRQKKINMALLSPYVSIISLNGNGLNYPIKTRVAEWIKINKIPYMLLIRDSSF